MVEAFDFGRVLSEPGAEPRRPTVPDETKGPGERPEPLQPAKPATEPANPNKPPEPKRQDDGQQTAGGAPDNQQQTPATGNDGEQKPEQDKRRDRKVGSQQDGEDPNLRSDMKTERNDPGLHGGSGSPGWSGRPKNREVENEMIGERKHEGEAPSPATEPPGGGGKS
jgi:hypothetical protein